MALPDLLIASRARRAGVSYRLRPPLVDRVPTEAPAWRPLGRAAATRLVPACAAVRPPPARAPTGPPANRPLLPPARTACVRAGPPRLPPLWAAVRAPRLPPLLTLPLCCAV